MLRLVLVMFDDGKPRDAMKTAAVEQFEAFLRAADESKSGN